MIYFVFFLPASFLFPMSAWIFNLWQKFFSSLLFLISSPLLALHVSMCHRICPCSFLHGICLCCMGCLVHLLTFYLLMVSLLVDPLHQPQLLLFIDFFALLFASTAITSFFFKMSSLPDFLSSLGLSWLSSAIFTPRYSHLFLLCFPLSASVFFLPFLLSNHQIARLSLHSLPPPFFPFLFLPPVHFLLRILESWSY